MISFFKKYKKPLNYIVIIIVMWAIYTKFKKDITTLDFSFLKNYFSQTSFYIFILFILLLALANIVLESIKWKLFLDTIRKTSLIKSLKLVLIGISTAMITPNRAGDFIGKVYLLPDEDKYVASFLAILSNMTQLFTTLLFGIIGFLYYKNSLLKFSSDYIFGITTGLILFMILAFLFLKKFQTILLSSAWFQKLKMHWVAAKQINLKLILKAFLISIMRFLIFNFQFYFILLYFIKDISFIDIFLMQSCFYLLVMVAPSNILTDISLRASLSIYLFSFVFNIPNEIILLASFGIYFVNIMLPAFVGTGFMIILNYKKNKHSL